MNTITSSIEIIGRDNEPIISQFVNTPESFFLTQSTKDQFFQNIDVNSTGMILENFQSSYKIFKIEMNTGLQSYKLSPIVDRLSNNDAFKLYILIVYLLGAVENILILIYFEEEKIDGYYFTFKQRIVIGAITLAIIITSGSLLVFWILTKYKMNKDIEIQSWINTHKGPPQYLREKLYVYLFKSFIGFKQVLQLILHIVFALLSYQSPIFAALHLLLIVNLNETMANVFNSIVLHADQLIQTLIMALFISYVFAIFNVIYYRDTFLSGISRDGEV